MFPVLVTVHCDERGVRLSRVTPHGEELVTETRQEVRQLAVDLWAALAKQPLEGHADTNLQVNRLSTRIDELYKHLAQQPLNGYDDLVTRIRELGAQVADLRTLTAERDNVQALELRECERRTQCSVSYVKSSAHSSTLQRIKENHAN